MYLRGDYQQLTTTLKAAFDDEALPDKVKAQFQRASELFFLGQLLGLPTLQSVLSKCGIQSNHLQKQYVKAVKSLRMHQIRKIFEMTFESVVRARLKPLLAKHPSLWSKIRLTAVLDDSIFRQWIKSQDEETVQYFGRFFSGQFRAVTCGFKVICLGLSIDQVYYPLYIAFVPKSDKNDSASQKQEKSATTRCLPLLKRLSAFLKTLPQEEESLPAIHLSVDSGYNDIKLFELCESLGFNYISVPKKNHKFQINGRQYKLSDWIEAQFLPAEKQHALKSEEDFVVRLRAEYTGKTMGEVTLLAFRLKGSNKVSIIFCPNPNIFAKTLRRHWFQRTYIEQFFKILKHTLQISEARSHNKTGFETKLWWFMLMGLAAQELVQFIRKRLPSFKNKGFITIQRTLCSDAGFLDLLQNKVSIKC